MNKPFNFPIPDEPYKQLFDKGNFVKCVYTGPRFLMLCVEKTTSIIHNVVAASETQETLPTLTDNDEQLTHIVFDATTNLVAAAYFTHTYTSEDVPDYVEELTALSFDNTPAKYTFKYASGGTGIIEQLLYAQAIRYNFDTNTFTAPEYRKHANTRESTINGFKNYADTIDNKLQVSAQSFNEDEYQTLQKFSNWLHNIETTYKDVDHWKIPFPTDIPALP